MQDAGPLLPIPAPAKPRADPKLARTIAVAGWIAARSDYVDQWGGLSSAGAERFTLVWESQELMALTRSMMDMILNQVENHCLRGPRYTPPPPLISEGEPGAGSSRQVNNGNDPQPGDVYFHAHPSWIHAMPVRLWWGVAGGGRGLSISPLPLISAPMQPHAIETTTHAYCKAAAGISGFLPSQSRRCTPGNAPGSTPRHPVEKPEPQTLLHPSPRLQLLQALARTGKYLIEKFVIHGLVGAVALPMTVLNVSGLIDSTWAIVTPPPSPHPAHARPALSTTTSSFYSGPEGVAPAHFAAGFCSIVT